VLLRDLRSGEFHWVLTDAFESRAEIDTGKRLQKQVKQRPEQPGRRPKPPMQISNPQPVRAWYFRRIVISCGRHLPLLVYFFAHKIRSMWAT
jgi:hypothetical protein